MSCNNCPDCPPQNLMVYPVCTNPDGTPLNKCQDDVQTPSDCINLTSTLNCIANIKNGSVLNDFLISLEQQICNLIVCFKCYPPCGNADELTATLVNFITIYKACFYNFINGCQYLITQLYCKNTPNSQTWKVYSLIYNGVTYISNTNVIASTKITNQNINFVTANNSNVITSCTSPYPVLKQGVTYTNFVDFLNSVFQTVVIDIKAQIAYNQCGIDSSSNQITYRPEGMYLIYPTTTSPNTTTLTTFTIGVSSTDQNNVSTFNWEYKESGVVNIVGFNNTPNYQFGQCTTGIDFNQTTVLETNLQNNSGYGGTKGCGIKIPVNQ
jgi:hypothetical protein